MAKRNKSILEEGDTPAEVRLNKYLSEAGYCSRREADKLIEDGRVTIDGEKAITGTKVKPGQKVCVNGKPISKEHQLVLIAVNKPVGIVCTTDRREPGNIIDFLGFNKRIFPIGRLDKDSEGLLLMTNDGDIVNKILRAGNQHEKEYIVMVNKPITEDFLQKMRNGIPIMDTVTRKCVVTQEGKDVFRIILTQGLNRQIRRMCEYCGYKVLGLQRVRIMNINLGRLKPGGYRNVTDAELADLKKMIKYSSK